MPTCGRLLLPLTLGVEEEGGNGEGVVMGVEGAIEGLMVVAKVLGIVTLFYLDYGYGLYVLKVDDVDAVEY
jgi:hypothetical protein